LNTIIKGDAPTSQLTTGAVKKEVNNQHFEKIFFKNNLNFLKHSVMGATNFFAIVRAQHYMLRFME
jgi:hypothetical protein